MASFRVVSEIAIDPDKECKTPTLMGASQATAAVALVMHRALAESVE
jgi:hypothetical protein